VGKTFSDEKSFSHTHLFFIINQVQTIDFTEIMCYNYNGRLLSERIFTMDKKLRFRPDGSFHILLVSDLHGGEKYFRPLNLRENKTA